MKWTNLYTVGTSVLTTGLVLAVTHSAFAVPSLQLDIQGGIYDAGSEQSVITDQSSFNLFAYCNIGDGNQCDPALNYYLEVSLLPKLNAVPSDAGFFKIDGLQYNVANLLYGNPPALQSHGIFDTRYQEIAFQFNPNQTRNSVNVADTPGTDPLTNAGSDLIYQLFTVDTSGLNTAYDLHFDLYSRTVENTRQDFAPFSHDARTKGHDRKVPEPSMITALAFLGMSFWKMKKR